MATKIIYFTVSGQKEQAEFLNDALSEDIKGMWHSLANIHHIFVGN